MVSVNNEHIYKAYMEQMFDGHGKSIESTIVWMHRNYQGLPNDFKEAKRCLTIQERNEIIRDILYPF